MSAGAGPGDGWLTRLNAMAPADALCELLVVCSSRRWAEQVTAARPFADADHLQRTADETWLEIRPADWLEALEGHPRIGERGGASAEHSQQEQVGVDGSAQAVLDAIAAGNQQYEERFGHVFLISAAGRGADEILAELRRRLANDPQTELGEAVEQHRRITTLRLDRLLVEPSSSATAARA